jgi:hypothetical protein
MVTLGADGHELIDIFVRGRYPFERLQPRWNDVVLL